MPPKVSICLPNLNTRHYLPERMRSILAQTLPDWELVIVDSYSEDGAWEFFQEQARTDPRLRISQAPRGLYAGWNHCVRQSRGEYIYFATSDDTMAPDCLEKMLGALEANPACGLCQCELKIIDAQGKDFPVPWREFAFGRFARGWLDRRHIRRAPLDGLLGFTLETIYTSITQLLIRRAVFDRVGMFDENWGTVGDFEWGVRVGLLEDCVYVPEPLASWRIHPQQISNGSDARAVRRKMLAMLQVAFHRAKSKSGHSLGRLPLQRLLSFSRKQIITLGLDQGGARRRTATFLASEILRGNTEALRYSFSWHQRQLFTEAAQFAFLRAMLDHLDIPSPVFL